MSHTKVQADPIQKVGLGQFNMLGSKVALHVKHQTVGAFFQAVVVVQRTVGVAAIVVEVKRLDQGGVAILGGGEQRHLHASCRATVHGV